MFKWLATSFLLMQTNRVKIVEFALVGVMPLSCCIFPQGRFGYGTLKFYFKKVGAKINFGA